MNKPVGKTTLQSLRDTIDHIDQELQTLINQRAQCAAQVADIKREQAQLQPDGSLSATCFYRPEREAQILRQVMDRNDGPLTDKTVAHLFREIMSACLALEKPIEVAYLGPEGTFTQAATTKHFGHAVLSSPQPTISEVFAQVETQQCSYGVVPVENSTEGMVSHTLDNFIHSPLKICGEVEMRIQLHLLAHRDTTPETIQTICAHEQALAQARHWLDSHWAQCKRQAVSSNAQAAHMAMHDATIAAIAGDATVERYQLVKVAANIEDFSNNTTRFLVIGHEAIAPSGDDKTSIIVSTRNQPGALFALLAPFNRERVGLTRIDTRPSRTQTWAYVFFMEFEGHQSDPVIEHILKELEETSMMIKLLGSYPKAVI